MFEFFKNLWNPFNTFPDQELLQWYKIKHGGKLPYEYLGSSGQYFYELDVIEFNKENKYES